MAHFAFVCAPAPGHVNPTLPLVRAGGGAAKASDVLEKLLTQQRLEGTD